MTNLCKITIRLTLDVMYEIGEVSSEEMEEVLLLIPHEAEIYGRLVGGKDARMISWSAEAEQV